MSNPTFTVTDLTNHHLTWQPLALPVRLRLVTRALSRGGGKPFQLLRQP